MFIHPNTSQLKTHWCVKLYDQVIQTGNLILDNIPSRPYVGPVPLTEGVSGDEPESERDAASCARGS